MRAGSKHGVTAVLAAAALVLASASIADPASAGGSGTAAGPVHIKGTLEAASDGRALRSSYVYAYSTGGTQLALGFTGRAGRYDVAIDNPTSDNRYLVCFEPRFVPLADEEPGFLPQCYDGVDWTGTGRPTGTPVRATVAAPATGIDGHLATSAAIAGQVTSSLDGPMAGVDVFLYSAPGHNVGGTQTGSDGRYVLHNLWPGTYLVCVNPYLRHRRIGRRVRRALQRRRSTGHRVGRRVPRAHRRGAARARSDRRHGLGRRQPVERSEVRARRLRRDRHQGRFGLVPRLGGSYRVTQLPPSRSYTVCVRTRNVTLSDTAGLLQPQCFDGIWWNTPSDGPPPGGTAEVRVQAGVETSDIDFAMVRGGAISGVVHLPQSFGDGTRVEVYSGHRLVATDYARRSRGSGAKYAVPGLAPGRYSVCFDNLTNFSFGASQCRSDQAWTGPGTPLPAQRTVLRVRAGAVISHIDATLAPSGAITGQVMGADGRYVYQAVATVLNSSGDLVARVPVDSSFALNVPASSAGYVLCIDPTDPAHPGSSLYLPQCWKNRSWDGDPADVPHRSAPIPISDGVATAELDFVLPLAHA